MRKFGLGFLYFLLLAVGIFSLEKMGSIIINGALYGNDENIKIFLLCILGVVCSVFGLNYLAEKVPDIKKYFYAFLMFGTLASVVFLIYSSIR
jgi:hypothetical protein